MDEQDEFQTEAERQDGRKHHILSVTERIVVAAISVTPFSKEGIADLMKGVHATATDLFDGAGDRERQGLPKKAPAVPIKKSVTDDYIICLEDGKPFKSMKRHLSASFDLTPEEYRERWGLPSDYPMTAPNYSKKRTALAKASGLGTKR